MSTFMLEAIITVILSVTSSDGDALYSIARGSYLTRETAGEHVMAARLAAAAYDVDADVLLSIAYHESRYLVTAVTMEPPDKQGHPRWSCGVMTPEPMTDHALCLENTRSSLAGYLAGASHLRAWLLQCRGALDCALRGYGGKAASEFKTRARWIRRAREGQNRT